MRKAYDYPAPGTWIELVFMDDKQAPPAGTRGTVTGHDDGGNVFVVWDNGSHLSLIPKVDEFKIISTSETLT